MITVVVVIVAVALIVAGVLLCARNTFAARAAAVQQAWRGVDTELRRRQTLIADLVRIVTASTRFDQDTLDRIATASAQAVAMRGQGPVMQSQPEQQLGAAVSRVFQVAEGCPDLKANPDFRFRNEQLVECEDRLAAGRRYYNQAVAAYNTGFGTLPERLVSGNYRMADYFAPDGPIGPSPDAAPSTKLVWSWAWLPGTAQHGTVRRGTLQRGAPEQTAPERTAPAPRSPVPRSPGR